MIDSPALSLPSRLTRQTLPDCSSQCVLEEELVVTNRDGCLHIKICNEAKKNVINRQVSRGFVKPLLVVGQSDESHSKSKDGFALAHFRAIMVLDIFRSNCWNVQWFKFVLWRFLEKFLYTEAISLHYSVHPYSVGGVGKF